jgi:hypothetical protein
MALKHQKYVDLPDGKMIGIHVFEPTATSHSVTVPELADTTAGESVAQLNKYGQTALGTAPTTTGSYTVTLTLTAAELVDATNDEIIFVTNHAARKGNFLSEDGTPASL